MNARTVYLIRRIMLTIPVLFATSIFVFLLIRLVPGDPVRTMLGIRATPSSIRTVRPTSDSITRWYGSTGTGSARP